MIDTAGRLQNKANLMEELAKMIRVIKKQDADAPHAVVLVSLMERADFTQGGVGFRFHNGSKCA